MIRVKVVGATGYGGVGITELVLRHPEAKLVSLIAREDVGQPISAVYPHLAGFCDLPILAAEDPRARETADVVFFATPDKVGMRAAPEELARGAKVIDYSGDFRFASAEAYADYATRIGKDPAHGAPELLGRTVYGLAELHRDAIRASALVGNPGCFACSCILGLAPAVRDGLLAPDSIICDCKTGVSGAGKKMNAAYHYPARYEQMNAYKLAGHQHVCEVERELSLLAGREVRITFTAQVVPVCRGILSTLYGTLTRSVPEAGLVALYRDFFRESPFVRVYGSQAAVGTLNVRGTNFCNLVVSVDARVNRLRVVAHIDNLMKGQAGSALQNMNLMFGLPETAGLDCPGIYP
ncbi:MAG: N-acetyl-gamma-glutamyl-phosphate reductase [Kiritimatiellia bacterium]|jgi:N-acetyl-gamma-glutamyl-phosphate reductase|nr:N-acetyl-gamma-glutamyl-phosphate reductase [Kiritimatiellia bacterium]